MHHHPPARSVIVILCATRNRQHAYSDIITATYAKIVKKKNKIIQFVITSVFGEAERYFTFLTTNSRRRNRIPC